MNKFYFAQKAFITNNGKLLMVQKNALDPLHPNEWEVPGGRMEFGETIEEHISREVMEEVGIEIFVGEPFDLWSWQMIKKDVCEGVIHCQVVAVARLCKPKTFKISTKNRVEDDFLGLSHWIPFNEILNYKLIPDILPTMKKFLSLVHEKELDN